MFISQCLYVCVWQVSWILLMSGVSGGGRAVTRLLLCYRSSPSAKAFGNGSVHNLWNTRSLFNSFQPKILFSKSNPRQVECGWRSFTTCWPLLYQVVHYKYLVDFNLKCLCIILEIVFISYRRYYRLIGYHVFQNRIQNPSVSVIIFLVGGHLLQWYVHRNKGVDINNR